MQTEAKDQFLARFAAPLSGAARRRIVVWHDADGEFSGIEVLRKLPVRVMPHHNAPPRQLVS